MIPEYLQQWLRIIEGMRNNNTYKFAWGKAIIELCVMKDLEDDSLCLSFTDIGEVMLKYYWNQIFFFDLDQGPNKQKKPELVTYTKEAIKYFNDKTGNQYPIWFDRALKIIRNDYDYYQKLLNKISVTLKANVCYRFMIVANETLPVYQLDKENRTITLTKDQVLILREYQPILFQLLNYKWASLLEKFNHSPRIIAKVKGSAENTMRRPSLKPYEKILLKYMPEGAYDFYTEQLLDASEISVDHVIPFSFNYDTRLWNLVITSKSNNSSKGNTVPSSEYIEKVKKRNIELLKKMDEKERYDLEEAIKNDYIDKLYNMLRG